MRNPGYINCTRNTVWTSDNTVTIPVAVCRNPMFHILWKPVAR